MSRLSVAKLVFAGTGILLFGLGIRWDHTGVRWAGIGLVAVAWVLRFMKKHDEGDGT